MTAQIKFGTSGWRAIIADEFTFANVRLTAEAIGRYVRTQNPSPIILVGYDTRFASEDFGREVARVMTSQGIRVKLCSRAVPTPAVAFTIMNEKLDGAVNITASHNPGEYSGIKFSGSDGAPALPGVTGAIEAEIERLQKSNWEFTATSDDALITSVDIGPAYLSNLATKIDFPKIKASGIKIGYDALHGSGGSYLDGVLRDNGITPTVLHVNRDVYFGGHHPEPAEEQMAELKRVMLQTGLQLGLATDGDADRFGVMDEGGDFIAPNELLAMLVDYLVESRKWRGGVARSVATTHLIDRVAKLHGLELMETPVGFKFIGEYIKEGRIILGGEESAGLSIRGHVPEKDGILACLLVAEMLASRGKSLKNQLKDLFSKVGAVYNRRLNVKLDPAISARVKAKIAADVQDFHGRRVVRRNRVDGLKLIFEDGSGNESWVLMRPSGTEPVVRFYAESTSVADLEQLLEYGKQWITEK